MVCARDLVRLNTTSEPYEVSMLWFLWYLRSAGGILRINGIENGAQERKLKGGTQQVCEKIVEKHLKDEVLLNSPVCKVQQSDSGVTVQTVDGRRYTAKYIIVAVPPPMTVRIAFDPPLPGKRNQLIQRVPMGKVIKTHMYYKTAFWRDTGCNGYATIDDEEGPVVGTMEDVKPDGSHPAIMGFILGDKAVKYSSLTKEQRKEEIAKLYSKVFHSEEALKPIHYEEKNWLHDQWAGGCYTVMMPPGFLTTYGREMRTPIGRIYFASTETATMWSGYMDGAIQAGERAAKEILYTMGKIEESEIWKTEPEDPDIRAMPLEYTFMERHLPSVPQFLKMCGFLCVACAASYFVIKHRR